MPGPEQKFDFQAKNMLITLKSTILVDSFTQDF